MDNEEGTTNNERPPGGDGAARASHPTAKAFFDALDSQSSHKFQSEKLKRKSQSLGWRNRFSQEAYYPVTIGSSSSSSSSSSTSFSVLQIQRGEVEGTYGTGATVWPAAMVLVKYMEKNPTLIVDKRIVDLGSGTGITSIAAAILGASHVTCTDGQDNVVQLAKDNIDHAAKQLEKCQTCNQIDTNSGAVRIGNCPVVVQKYWWGQDKCIPRDDKNVTCHVVVVADCVLPKLYPIEPLVEAIDELLNTPTSIAILSYEHRYYADYDPRDKFRELATCRKLQVTTISSEHLDPVYCVDDVEIWHVQRVI